MDTVSIDALSWIYSILDTVSRIQYTASRIQYSDTTLRNFKYVPNPDTTLSVFLSMYQFRYNSLCILKYVSIQIQLSQTLCSLPRTYSDRNETEFIFN